MKSEKGITLISVILTILLLGIIVGIVITNGVDTYGNSKVVAFETQMQMIQKKVDIAVEEGSVIGTALDDTQKEKLSQILSEDDASGNYIKTSTINDVSLRFFSGSDIANEFDIQNVQDDFIINFANREVINLNGVEKDGVMHYVLEGLQ